MMSRIEPRAAAYGERLWRGPETGGWLEAERRLVRHRWALWAFGQLAEITFSIYTNNFIQLQ